MGDVNGRRWAARGAPRWRRARVFTRSIRSGLLATAAVVAMATRVGAENLDQRQHTHGGAGPIMIRGTGDDWTLTPEQAATVALIQKSRGTMSFGMMRLGGMAAMMGSAAPEAGAAPPRPGAGLRFVLPLPGGREIALVRRAATVAVDGGLTWRGTVEETGERAILMLWRDGHLSGHFSYKGRIFVVGHIKDDVHTMTEVDPETLPPDHDPARSDASAQKGVDTVMVEPAVRPFADDARMALEAKPITINIMMLYTPASARHYIQPPADLLALSIAGANETFAGSGLGNVKLRLVHTQMVDYDEARGEHYDHLYRMIDGLPPFADVKRLRREKQAAIVGLIMDSPGGCGLSARVGGDAEDAFFVAHHACAALLHTIAHEVGHILGARHDRRADPADWPYVYAHGFVNGRKWRDIMSYRASCDGCPRLPFFSNPRLRLDGEPMGTPASDNARVILENAERVSRFR